VDTSGQVADGTAESRSVSLVLGTTTSSDTSLSVSISSSGQLTVNGVSTGTVTLAPLTGAL
jgi:hypothetical protein